MSSDFFTRLCLNDASIVCVDQRNHADVDDFSLRLMCALMTNTRLERLVLSPKNATERRRCEALLSYALYVNPMRPSASSWIYADGSDENIYCRLAHAKSPIHFLAFLSE